MCRSSEYPERIQTTRSSSRNLHSLPTFLPGMRPAFASFRSQSDVTWRKAAASSSVRVVIYPPYPV
ncbi:hypothetical protein BOX30_05285 [Leptospirillum ferriphilum]|nr:hypothetical protein [Leptospirillum ferriphilum]OOH80754.1 hypothetical protein BOX30_05285 [Leptospirillum ferriphilum]